MVHPSEDQIEAYAMGRLPTPEIAWVEEHLLVCDPCRSALEAEDQYLKSMRVALRLPAAAPARASWRFTGRGLAWAGGLAVTVAFLLLAPWTSPPAAPVAVTLSSFRGSQIVTMAHAPSGTPLDLGIDSVAATRECRIEIVDAGGETKWNGGLTVSPAGLQARVEKGLSPGQYWVRLYAPDSQLLQEFGLRLD